MDIRERLPHFRLRSLLLVVALAALAMGVVVDLLRARERARHAHLEQSWAVLAGDADNLARSWEEAGKHRRAKSMREQAALYRRKAAEHARQRRPDESPWGPVRQP